MGDARGESRNLRCDIYEQNRFFRGGVFYFQFSESLHWRVETGLGMPFEDLPCPEGLLQRTIGWASLKA